MTTLKQQLEGKRVGLVLSAGFFGFFGHAGFVDGLLQNGITPAAWAGTSAGGMIAGLCAAGLTPSHVAELLVARKKEHFWDPDFLGIAVDALKKGHRPSGLLKGARFAKLLQEFLPVQTFEELKVPLLILTTNLTTQSAHVITTGEIASAIHATCAYPGLFQAVRREGDLHWDGGIVDKAPALALQEFAGDKIDALLVHYLPSRDGEKEPRGAFSYVSGMASGMAAIRKDHFRLQLELLRARGVEVHVVTSELPPVSPNELHRGADAVAAGRASAIHALNQRA